MIDFQYIKVGSLYPFDLPQADNVQCELFTVANTITLFLSSPTRNEIASMQAGQPLSIGCNTLQTDYGFGCVFYLVSTLSGKDNTTVYEAQLNTKLLTETNQQFVVEPYKNEDRLQTDILLVDRDTGLIKAIRNVALAPNVSSALVMSALEQVKSRNTLQGNANANALLINQHSTVFDAVDHTHLFPCGI